MTATESVIATNGIPGTRRAVVRFDGSAVVIKRGLFGTNTTTIPVSRITSIGWHKGVLGSGHIEFTAAGIDGVVEFGPLWGRQFEALRDAAQAAMAA